VIGLTLRRLNADESWTPDIHCRISGPAMNRYRGTQAEFQFSRVSPHTAHSKLLISRDSTICSLRS
jgi:hypothetical protein